jgi:hypothetical protein
LDFPKQSVQLSALKYINDKINLQQPRLCLREGYHGCLKGRTGMPNSEVIVILSPHPRATMARVGEAQRKVASGKRFEAAVKANGGTIQLCGGNAAGVLDRPAPRCAGSSRRCWARKTSNHRPGPPAETEDGA